MNPTSLRLVRRAAPIVLLAGFATAPAVRAAVPGEVQNLRISADRRTLSWDAEPSATHYIVYRGYARDLSPTFLGTFLDAEIASTSTSDTTVPAAGEAFVYLVTGWNTEGEGPMGWSGPPAVRTNHDPWPGNAVAGKWSGLRSWPDIAIHMSLLRTGKVLTWQGSVPTRSRIYDPVTDTATTQNVNENIFCSGHSFLPDGKLLVSGGNTFLFGGPNSSHIFDPGAASNGWSAGPSMNLGRYYPTTHTLGDGRVIVFSGNKGDNTANGDVEIYSTQGQGRWTLQPGGFRVMNLYPRFHLMPNGRLFRSGEEQQTMTYDVPGQSWQNVAQSLYGTRAEPNSFILPGSTWKVMIVGGRLANQEWATNTAEIIDLSQASPAWSWTAPMRFRRLFSNSVLLPDGKVLTVGGGYNDFIAAYPAEMYDPATATWTVVAQMRRHRLYHSTALLLPDGRVLAGGSDGNATLEFFSPGYLFRGARPVISSAPTSVGYGANFTVGTSDAASITSVVFMKPGTVTHAFDYDQRYVKLSFTAGSSSLTVTAPANGNLAPPGYYMLFILNGNGVPSEAKFVKLG